MGEGEGDAFPASVLGLIRDCLLLDDRLLWRVARMFLLLTEECNEVPDAWRVQSEELDEGGIVK